MNSCLLWDFDGVIVDSIEECLLVSYNAFLKYEMISNDFFEDVKSIPVSVREEFRKTRKYVRRAGGYYILHQAMALGQKIQDRAGFEELFEDNIQAVKDYEDFFFSARVQLRAQRPQYWLDLHHPYAWVKDKWEGLKQFFDFYVVSNKDVFSISLLLRNAGLALEEDHLFGQEFSSDKRMIIKHILDQTKVEKGRILFVDDNYYHLLDVRDLGVQLFFATWGYGELPLKLDNEITFLNVGNFDEQLLKGKK